MGKIYYKNFERRDLSKIQGHQSNIVVKITTVPVTAIMKMALTILKYALFNYKNYFFNILIKINLFIKLLFN